MVHNDLNYDFITMFEEAQLKLERQFSSMETLRKHGKLILGSSSVVISLFSSFKLISTKIDPQFFLQYFALIFLMSLYYCLLMYYSIKSILPFPLEHAIEPTWKTYIEAFHEESNREILKRRVYAYLKAIEHNEKTIIKQYDIAKKSNIYMTLLILSIIFIALIVPIISV